MASEIVWPNPFHFGIKIKEKKEKWRIASPVNNKEITGQAVISAYLEEPQFRNLAAFHAGPARARRSPSY